MFMSISKNQEDLCFKECSGSSNNFPEEAPLFDLIAWINLNVCLHVTWSDHFSVGFVPNQGKKWLSSMYTPFYVQQIIALIDPP